jgi:hypothetical protein
MNTESKLKYNFDSIDYRYIIDLALFFIIQSRSIMLKFTSLAIGLLTVLAIAPKSEAMTATINSPSLHQPTGDLHAQLIIKIGDTSTNNHRYSDYEYEREREAAAARRRAYYARHRRYENREYREYRNENREYRNENREYHGESHRSH